MDGPDQEKELLELLSALDSFHPVLPDALLDYHFTRAGLQCEDPRLRKLIALTVQKWVTDVASDALAHQRIRQSGSAASGGASGSSSGQQKKKAVLQLEDLSAALAERGIEVRKPPYHI